MTESSPVIIDITLAHHHYKVYTGGNLLAQARETLLPYLKIPHAVIITDETVQSLHLQVLKQALEQTDIRLDILAVPEGEKSKSLHRYSLLIEEILQKGIERHTTIIALGGGVVGDLAGFVAATALRGLPFIQIPTTLLAQVDSSVGGKTGINARSGKNLIGAFWQPDLVLADSGILQTLPRRQLVAGYAEIVKSGLIADPSLFEWCEHHGANVLEGDSTALKEAVRRACLFKARIVASDEREQASQGGRALLNLGHTFGHALEAEYQYDGRLLHGEAVSAGLHLALALSVALGLAPQEDLKRLDRHLETLKMPCRLTDLPTRLSAEALIAHMQKDKKRKAGLINFVLLRGIGRAFTTPDISTEAVRSLLLAEGCLP